MKQNLPGGTSAVVPPDPMPNSEVKRRSADGSVGSPHARVGNCQASNKWKTSVERLGFFDMENLKRKACAEATGTWQPSGTYFSDELPDKPHSPLLLRQHHMQ